MDVAKKAKKGRIINSVIRPEENLCHKLAKKTREQILHRSGNIAFSAAWTILKIKLTPDLCSAIIHCYVIQVQFRFASGFITKIWKITIMLKVISKT